MGGNEESPAISGGVRVFSIAGRMAHQRERLMGMTNEERRWRAQFLKDQILPPNEPRFCPELYKTTNNAFVRMVRFPLNMFEKALTPVLGESKAGTVRFFVGKLIVAYMSLMCITYYLKYNEQDWSRNGGWLITKGKERQLPGDQDFPKIYKKEKYEYADQGFSKTIFGSS